MTVTPFNDRGNMEVTDHHGFMSATQLFSHKRWDEDDEITFTPASCSPHTSAPNTTPHTSTAAAVQPGGMVPPKGTISPRGSTETQLLHPDPSPQSIIDGNDGQVSLNVTSSPVHDHPEAGRTTAGSGM